MNPEDIMENKPITKRETLMIHFIPKIDKVIQTEIE